MRILFFARKKRRTRTPAHLVKALKGLGHEVRFIRYGFWTQFTGRKLGDWLLRRMARRFDPDLVLTWKECISIRLLAALAGSYKTALYCVDWFEEPPEGLCQRARVVDLFLITNSGQLDTYTGAGVRRPVFWPQACDTDEYRAVDSAPEHMQSDVAFVGAPGNELRRQLLQMVGREFDLKIWGARWDGLADDYRGVQGREILPQQYGEICAAAKVMLGCDAMRGVEHCFSNRMWLTLGCRGFLLTNYSPGLETFFENHRHLVWYHSPEECLGLLRHYLPLEEDRRRIAQAGFDLIRSKHTYRHRAQQLIDMVNDLPDRRASGSQSAQP